MKPQANLRGESNDLFESTMKNDRKANEDIIINIPIDLSQKNENIGKNSINFSSPKYASKSNKVETTAGSTIIVNGSQQKDNFKSN